jgi:hypothetical protein
MTVKQNVEVYIIHLIDAISRSKAGFTGGGGSRPLPRGLQRTEIESADFIESFAYLKSLYDG